MAANRHIKVLGISAYYHDSAAALVENGEIVAAVQEERFTRVKHDASFPQNAVDFCLKQGGVALSELDAVVFYEKPFLKFERLLETYLENAPRGLRSFHAAMPVWIKEKLFLQKLILDELKMIGSFDDPKLLFTEHHLSHGASAFYPSPFTEAAILTIDAVGEWATATIARGEGNKVEIIKQMDFPNSLGLLYSAFTYYLGFKVNSGEYKLMGLAPYGNHNSSRVIGFEKKIRENLVVVHSDGSITINQPFFDYETGLKMVKDKQWERLFGFPKRQAEAAIEQNHCDLALAIQNVTEDVVLKMANEAKRLTKSEFLCMAGGVALNCVANGKLHRSGLFKKIFIQPAAGDAGGALGAALAAHYIYFNNTRKVGPGLDSMQGAFLGPEFSDAEIKSVLQKFKSPSRYFSNFSDLVETVCQLLEQGSVIGWFQGRTEWGPRALGNRSIIGDPRRMDMQFKLNTKIKYRESFRPFAPAVLEEDVGNYFELHEPSPYMLLVADIISQHRLALPHDFEQLPVRKKLYFQRSDIPAVTHVDFSARIQTVHKATNERFWELLYTFKNLTGCSVLVNTSFNVRGEPIVCTPEDAYRCFMRTEMDYLVMGNFLINKQDQPLWPVEDNWKKEYELD